MGVFFWKMEESKNWGEGESGFCLEGKKRKFKRRGSRNFCKRKG